MTFRITVLTPMQRKGALLPVTSGTGEEACRMNPGLENSGVWQQTEVPVYKKLT